MADLSWSDTRSLERLFRMGGGYVLDFSHRTFDEFVIDYTGRSIYDHKYDLESGSKANRLRAFWTEEGNHLVAKLLTALIDYAESLGDADLRVVETCRKIVLRLEQDVSVVELDALTQVAAEHDFEVVAKAVREHIENNDPVAGLDRLHTFVTKYLRKVCASRGIDADRRKPLHSIFGEYIKALKTAGEIEAEMTSRILKANISVLEAFNHVRNNQSLAHDNALLGYEEALLIFRHVESVVRFVRELERRRERRKVQGQSDGLTGVDDDIPF